MSDEVSQLLPVPEAYTVLMKRLQGHTILGIKIDDSLMLRGLVCLAAEIAVQHGNVAEAFYRVQFLVLGNLAAMFTFNNVDLEASEEFPSKLPVIERERWFLCRRYPELDQGTLDYLAPGRYREGDIRLLSTQLGARIGDCPIYAITLGVAAVCAGLCERGVLVGAPPHAWFACSLRGMSDGLQPHDLSAWSHGRLEDDVPPETYALEQAKYRIPIWPLEECTL